MLLSLTVAVVAGCWAAAAAPAGRPWLAPGQPIATRVSALLAAMTLEEKVAQLSYECPPTMDWATLPYATTGIGSVGIECSGIPGDAAACNVSCRIANLRKFQQDALAQTRLGIPTTFVIETSHCGAAGGTIFPMGVTQGASFNVSLAGAVARAIALEARSWGGSRGLSPEINVVTDPRFGRTEENFGADPLLVAQMAAAAVTGLQGGIVAPTEYLPDWASGIGAEAKHCCAYGFSGLDGGAADISDKTFHDVYLKPWRAFIRAGGSGMMMSHNEINGVPMHANGDVIGTLFRDTWNYSGFVHSDYGNIGALTSARVAANTTEAAGLALAAGLDQDFMDVAYDASVVVPGIAAGLVAAADVDRAAGKVLQAKFAAGLFDGALPDPAARPNIYSAAHRALARAAAAEGAVLLSNRNGTLPLRMGPSAGGVRTLAVIGPNSGCATTPLLQQQLRRRPGSSTAAALSSSSSYSAGVGGCALYNDTDCDGDDLDKVDGVADAAACCALCSANASCIVAVLATDQGQCLLKGGCPNPTAATARIAIDVGRLPPLAATPWSCPAMRGMLGGYSNLERATDASLDNAAHVVTLLEAAAAAANASGGAFAVTWAPGVAQAGFDRSGIPAAAAAAAAADAAVVVLGDGGEAVGYDSSVSCGEGADRPSLDLPGAQLDLLAAVLATGTPTVIVLVHGRPVTFGGDYGGSSASKFTDAPGAAPLDARAGALLAAWRPGCEGGHALWDLLTGAASPSGRLPQAWPASVGGARIGGVGDHLHKFSVQGGDAWTLGAPFAPAYAFGHGLDYLQVSFGASSAAVDAAAQTVTVDVQLLNAAAAGGAYVVQVYFSQAHSRYTRYRLMLAGFAKAAVPAAGQISVQLVIPYADLAYYYPATGQMVLEGGQYTFYVCAAADRCADANSHTVQVPATVTGL